MPYVLQVLPLCSHYIVHCKHALFAHAVQPTFLHSCAATLLPTPHIIIHQSLPTNASNTHPCYMQCPQMCPRSPAFWWTCTPLLPQQMKNKPCSGRKESLRSQLQSPKAILLTDSPGSTGDVSVPFPGTYGEGEDDWRWILSSWFHHSGTAVCLGAEAVAQPVRSFLNLVPLSPRDCCCLNNRHRLPTLDNSTHILLLEK